MEKRWIMREKVTTSVHSGIHPVVAAILASRGYTAASEIAAFLKPELAQILDPMLLKDMEAAVVRIVLARRNNETICVYGDYDVDGITSTTLLVSFLRQVGCICRYFIPNRFDDGYGLNSDSLQECHRQGASLVISVDCGITSVEEALVCRQIGMDLIITDHHMPRSTIPDCCAVLNPLQPDCGYPFKGLAGVGVVFNLLIALRAALRREGAFSTREPDLRQWLDLLAIGTIADVVPLVGQNRIYVYHGLQLLSRSGRPGIMALKQVARIADPVRCGQVGFQLAPRLNAAGRMESAVPGVDLLLGSDPQTCQTLAEELDAANAERQQIERAILEQACTMVEQSAYPAIKSIVLASDQWHQGVIGIVASRLVERYHRPTVLIALDNGGTGKGSGRSVPGFHLLQAISACSSTVTRFGGHRYAAGIGIRADQVESFRSAFEAEAERLLSDDDCIPVVTIDAEVPAAEVTTELALALKLLEPFGAGNPEPLLRMCGVTVVERRVVGEKHLRLKLTKDGRTFNAIAFGMAAVTTDGLIDIAFFPEENSYNGATTLQLRIKELRASKTATMGMDE